MCPSSGADLVSSLWTYFKLVFISFLTISDNLPPLFFVFCFLFFLFVIDEFCASNAIWNKLSISSPWSVGYILHSRSVWVITTNMGNWKGAFTVITFPGRIFMISFNLIMLSISLSLSLFPFSISFFYFLFLSSRCFCCSCGNRLKLLSPSLSGFQTKKFWFFTWLTHISGHNQRRDCYTYYCCLFCWAHSCSLCDF